MGGHRFPAGIWQSDGLVLQDHLHALAGQAVCQGKSCQQASENGDTDIDLVSSVPVPGLFQDS